MLGNISFYHFRFRLANLPLSFPSDMLLKPCSAPVLVLLTISNVIFRIGVFSSEDGALLACILRMV
jgi:hypothetical protein